MLAFLLLPLAGAAAWFISTVAAGGAATVLIPVVGLVLGAQLVAPVIAVASLCANPSRAWLFRDSIDWPVMRWLLPGTLLGSALGAWSLSRIPLGWLEIILGLFLLATVAYYYRGRWRPRLRVTRLWFLPLGAGSAYLSGLVGGTGPVLNPFLLAYGLEKEHLVGTKAVNALVMQLAKIGTYALFGIMTLRVGLYGVLLGLGAVAGVWLARNHLLAVDRTRFRHYVMLMMAGAGVLMLLRGLGP